MLFSEPAFLFLFLPVLLAAHFLCPSRHRNLLLLGASLLFYASGESICVLVMLTSIAFTFLVGLWIDQTRGKRPAKLPLVVGVAGNLALLASYKYANFFMETLNTALDFLGVPTLAITPIHLPIGISFFTFQAISYVVDVHRKETGVQSSPIRLALYIALFPQLIAGPIVRYGDVFRQLVKRTVDLELFASGIRRFVIGLGKKMIIANSVAVPADQIFAIRSSELTFGLSWLAVACYTLQIYFDFSGYSDMAIGLGRMFGFRFKENFDFPYVSRSITEFWRRWHMSLSRWFRDYLYIPLGGNRRSPRRVHINLVTVFFLCGLWHGASWNFIIWGLYHGAFLILERSRVGSRLSTLHPVARHGYVVFVVLVGWVFFRAETLGHAVAFFGAMAGLGHGAGTYYNIHQFLHLKVILVLLVGVVGSTPISYSLSTVGESVLARVRGWSRTAFLLCWRGGELSFILAVLLYSSMLMAVDTHNPFIYFRF